MLLLEMRLLMDNPGAVIIQSSCIGTSLGIVPVPPCCWIFQYFNWLLQNTKDYITDISGKIVKYELLIPVYAMPKDVPMQVDLYIGRQSEALEETGGYRLPQPPSPATVPTN